MRLVALSLWLSFSVIFYLSKREEGENRDSLIAYALLPTSFCYILVERSAIKKTLFSRKRRFWSGTFEKSFSEFPFLKSLCFVYSSHIQVLRKE